MFPLLCLVSQLVFASLLIRTIRERPVDLPLQGYTKNEPILKNIRSQWPYTGPVSIVALSNSTITTPSGSSNALDLINFQALSEQQSLRLSFRPRSSTSINLVSALAQTSYAFFVGSSGLQISWYSNENGEIVGNQKRLSTRPLSISIETTNGPVVITNLTDDEVYSAKLWSKEGFGAQLTGHYRLQSFLQSHYAGMLHITDLNNRFAIQEGIANANFVTLTKGRVTPQSFLLDLQNKLVASGISPDVLTVDLVKYDTLPDILQISLLEWTNHTTGVYYINPNEYTSNIQATSATLGLYNFDGTGDAEIFDGISPGNAGVFEMPPGVTTSPAPIIFQWPVLWTYTGNNDEQNLLRRLFERWTIEYTKSWNKNVLERIVDDIGGPSAGLTSSDVPDAENPLILLSTTGIDGYVSLTPHDALLPNLSGPYGTQNLTLGSTFFSSSTRLEDLWYTDIRLATIAPAQTLAFIDALYKTMAHTYMESTTNNPGGYSQYFTLPSDSAQGPTYLRQLWPFDFNIRSFIAPKTAEAFLSLVPTTQTFTYASSEQTFMIPNDATKVVIHAYGAGGSSTISSTKGSHGSYIRTSLTGLEGHTLKIRIGQGGGRTASFKAGGLALDLKTLGGGSTTIVDGGLSGSGTLSLVVAAGGGSGGQKSNGFSEGQTVHLKDFNSFINQSDEDSGAGGAGYVNGRSSKNGFGGTSGTSFTIGRQSFKTIQIESMPYWDSSAAIGTYGLPAGHGLVVLELFN